MNPGEESFLAYSASFVDGEAVGQAASEVSSFISNLFGSKPEEPNPFDNFQPEEVYLNSCTNTNFLKPEKPSSEKKPRLILFIVGGVSLGEIRAVHALSKELHCDILIGNQLFAGDFYMNQVLPILLILYLL